MYLLYPLTYLKLNKLNFLQLFGIFQDQKPL